MLKSKKQKKNSKDNNEINKDLKKEKKSENLKKAKDLKNKDKKKRKNLKKQEKQKEKQELKNKSKEERQQIKAKNKAAKSNKKSTITEQPEFMVENLPYNFTPSYIEHNGKYESILQMYIRPGSNKDLTYEDVIDFIPVSTLQGVQMYLISDDVLIKDDEKKRVIKKNASLNKAALEDTDRSEGDKKTDDQSAKNTRQVEMNDYDEYELILDKADPVVVFRWSLVLIADYKEDIEEQIELINTTLDQRHDGARWDSLPGEQMKRFAGLFDELDKTHYELTATAGNYSGLNLAVNSGLNDPKGMPIGSNALALTQSSAYFDFERSTFKQAAIAMARGSSSLSYYYLDETTKQPSVPSMIAQYAANQFVIEGHKVHHIVLNDFDYFESGRYYRDKVINKIFTEYDVSKLTINILQGFGDINKVVQVYSRLVEKVANIFDLMLGLKMDKDDKGIVLNAIEQFYFDNGLWNTNAAEKPKMTNIVDIDRPELYPTAADLLNDFDALANTAANKGREMKADRIETLSATLQQNLSAYTSVLGRTTSVKDTDAMQVYYSFKNIESLQLRQIQLVNIIDYVIYKAKKDDVIIIHGFDSVLTRVAEMILSSVKAAQDKGVRFIYTYDSVKSPKSVEGQMNDLFEMQNSYYIDLDTDMDWSMIGRTIPEELKIYKKAINQELGATISEVMQQKYGNRILIHRHNGNVNDFVNLRFII